MNASTAMYGAAVARLVCKCGGSWGRVSATQGHLIILSRKLLLICRAQPSMIGNNFSMVIEGGGLRRGVWSVGWCCGWWRAWDFQEWLVMVGAGDSAHDKLHAFS